ncbi:MAG TPA: lysophospholipid acyltransferase family protein [Acidimicrobiia bacterium]|nr:lysophospholipid acyltransferase family protein [Acidimicrobiia bacterium]
MSRRFSIVYSLASAVALPLYSLVARTHIEGEHFVPSKGGAILASNHISFVDPLSLGCLVHRRKRQVHFLAKDSLFKNPILRWFFTSAGAIPVARNTVQAADSLIHAQAALQRGHLVAIYPEATMSADLVQLPIKSGALRLAVQASVPIVVVGVWGSQDIWRKGHRPHFRFRRPLAMVVLPPYTLAADEDIDKGREVLAEKMLHATALAKAKLGVHR